MSIAPKRDHRFQRRSDPSRSSAPRLSTAQRAVLFVPPAVLMVLGLIHPTVAAQAGIYGILQPQAWLWLVVHLLQAPALALLAFGLFQMTRGLTGSTAQASRLAAVAFGVLYVAYDAAVGIGTGLQAIGTADLPAEARSGAIQAIDAYWQNGLYGNASVLGYAASVSWAVAAMAAGLAVYRAGATLLPVALLATAGLWYAISHVLPFGPMAMLSFLMAAWLLEQQRAAGSLRQRPTA